MDTKEVDATAVAETVDVFIFHLPRAVSDADSPCWHYENMKMVQEPL